MDTDDVVVLESSSSSSSFLLMDHQPPAPLSNFKQAVGNVPNRFEVGMKLEVPDPKAVVNTICIATVVDKIGPRLRLRLDGTGEREFHEFLPLSLFSFFLSFFLSFGTGE